MNTKTIQIFDSQGENNENNKFLKAVKKYMYDALTKNAEGKRQDFGIWRQGWTTTEESRTSPRQENGYDWESLTKRP